MTPAQEAIVQAASEAGEDPRFALAVASRESNFNPTAHSSKTIHGIYQMRGDLRQKYGVGDSNDPLDQARGWMKSLPDIRASMKKTLGRDPTDQEVYLGHHYGAARAARTLKMNPDMPVESVFTPQEMAGNPHFARAGTIGNLNGSVMGDIDKRMARFGGAASSPAAAEPANSSQAAAQPADLSSFAEPADLSSVSDPVQQPQLADLSSVSDPAEQPTVQAAASAPPDLSSFGTPV